MTIRAALAAAALTLALPACAAPAGQAADADPALWVVKDADTTVYLFGTIHVLKPGLSWFDEAVRTAFDRSDALVLEMVQPDPAAMRGIVMAKGMAPAGTKLGALVPPRNRAAFRAAVTASGVPAAAFDRMRPWLAAVTLSLSPIEKMGYVAENGPETVLADAAKTAGKPIVGLETAEQQIGYFGALSDGAQMEFLTSTLDELPKAGAQMATMVREWSSGDSAALARDLNESLKDTPEVARVLLTERNARWAGWVRERLKTPGTVFVAVGAGHLAGTRSVQAQLAKAGVSAVRVKY